MHQRQLAIALLIAAISGACTQDSTTRVWFPDSQKIEIVSFGYWSGSTGYSQSRDALTPTQLSRLADLHTITPVDTRVEDIVTHEIAITANNGDVQHYRAAELNQGEASDPVHTIDTDSLEAFTQTYACLEAGSTRSFEPMLPPWQDGGAKRASLSLDPGCLNGVFMIYDCSSEIWLAVPVTGASTIEFSWLECAAPSQLAVFSPNGSEMLAASAAADDCGAVRYSFPEAGQYALRITGCAENGEGRGDALLRTRSLAAE